MLHFFVFIELCEDSNKFQIGHVGFSLFFIYLFIYFFFSTNWFINLFIYNILFN